MKIFQSYLIFTSFECPSWEDFIMSLFFDFDQAVLEIFDSLCSKKWEFFRQDLKRTHLSRIAPKRRFLMGSFNFLGISTNNFVKNDAKFENKDFFMQNFLKLYMRKFLDPKAVTFDVWGLKTSLGQFGPKRCIMPYVWKPGSSFQKHDPIFSTIKIWI